MLIAPFRDLQIGKMSAGRNQPSLLRLGKIIHILHDHSGIRPFHRAVTEQSVDHFRNLIVGCGSEHRIHFRDFLQDLLFITLCQTACHDQFLKDSRLFKLSHFQNSLNTLFLGIVDKTAGINDHNIRLRLIIDHLMPLLCQKSQHHFRIHQILIAAQ